MQIELIDERNFLESFSKEWEDFRLDSKNLQKCKNFIDYLESIATYLIINYEKGGKIKKKLFIELILTNDTSIRTINNDFLQKDYATDVLSFPLEIVEGLKTKQCFGSIIINTNEAINKSIENRHSIYVELAILFIHAFLHLLGFNHENDSGQHRAIERKAIDFFELKVGLIDRNL